MLTRNQHNIEEGRLPGHKHTPEELRAIIYPIRIKQGFVP
jgi:hypothetical protein